MKKYKNIVPLVFIFLCLKTEAEFAHSALVIEYFQNNKIEEEYIRDYEIAKILYKEEKYVESLKRVLPLSNIKFNNSNFEAKINLLIGKIFTKDRENEKALIYLKRSYSIFTKLNKEMDSDLSNNLPDDYLYAENLLQLSFSYQDLRKIDSSRIYLEKLIKIESVNKDIDILKANAYLNLGRIYAENLKDFTKAEELFKKSIKEYSKFGNNLSIALAHNNLANLYVEKKKYNKAREIYGTALTYLKNEKSRKALQRKELLYDNIAWALYNLKDYRAYEFVTDSYAIRDSLKQDDLTKQVAQIKAENDVKLVQQAAEEEQLKQEQKTWVVGAIGAAVSMLLLYLANLFKLRQRNLSLKLSQNELRQQRKLERLNSQAQVKILNATLDGKETERKQIAEILHDNVSALLSSANMHLEATQKQYGDNTPEELQKTRQIITEASEKIRDLSHNLVSSVLLKFGLEYAIKDLAKKFSNSEIKISTAISNVYRYSQDFEIKIFNIVQELVNNIIKHSNAKNAYIMLEEEDDNINLIVKDDGVGFEQRSEEESGIGLNQIKARINMMNGNFLIESTKGSGTKVIASVPVIRKENVVPA